MGGAARHPVTQHRTKIVFDWRRVAVVHLLRQAGNQGSIGQRDQLAGTAQLTAPDPVVLRFVMLAERNPRKAETAVAIAGGLRGIETAAVETVEFSALPRAFG